MKNNTTEVQAQRVKAMTVCLVVLLLFLPLLGNIILTKFKTTGTWDVVGIVLFVASILWSFRLGTLLWAARRR